MTSPVGLTVVGLCTILLTVGILIRGKVNPIVPMTLVPIAAALLTGHGFGDVGDFFGEGLESVMNVVVMFIFAIIFFGILQDVGLFTPIITWLMRLTKGNVVAVTTGTAAIGVVAHLDGSGSTTFLLTIPALRPLYKEIGISRYVLITIVALAASVMNMVPWGGPLGRAGAVVAEDPNQIWVKLLPIQAAAVILVLIAAALLGMREQRKLRARVAVNAGGAGVRDDAAANPEAGSGVDVDRLATEFAARQKEERDKAAYTYRRGRGVVVLNAILVLVVLATLLSGLLPPAPTFLIATTLALLINFPDAFSQAESLRRHAPNALSMAGVILAAAMFLGVLNGTGMLEAIALQLVNVLPDALGPYLHIIIGFFGVPLDLLTSTDAYYFSVLPIVQQTAGAFGVSGMGAACALIIGNVVGTFVSPFSPALWLALGLAEGANMGTYLKKAVPIAWFFSIVLVAAAWAVGTLA